MAGQGGGEIVEGARRWSEEHVELEQGYCTYKCYEWMKIQDRTTRLPAMTLKFWI
jgi:hypothetical protein